jgi:hypothetical protein
MTWTTHLAVGSAIAVATKTPALAIPAAFCSHGILDCFCLYHPQPEELIKVDTLPKKILLGFSIIGFIIWLLLVHAHTNLILYGLLAWAGFDIEWLICIITKGKDYYPIHSFFNRRVVKSWGVILEIIVTIVSLILIAVYI